LDKSKLIYAGFLLLCNQNRRFKVGSESLKYSERGTEWTIVIIHPVKYRKKIIKSRIAVKKYE